VCLILLTTCLQKTAPPVLIFAENKKDVDAIHEFLLVKVREGGGEAEGKGLSMTATWCT
jgi:ATP-dependent RNA helicase DDX41